MNFYYKVSGKYAFLANIEMGDHLSPVMEGFENPTMATIFGELLQITSTSKNASSGKIAFLKSILEQQKSTADSLMKSAKKIGPISQRIENKDSAYDAAFESDLIAPIPNTSGALQGFAYVFFLLSFISLAIVVVIGVSQTSGNISYILGSVGAFIFLIILSLLLLQRYG